MLVVVGGGELGAIQSFGPRVTEISQHWLAPVPNALAQWFARTDGHHDFLCAHGEVNRTEEKLEPTRAAVLDERGKGLQKKDGIFLVCVLHQIRHASDIVTQALAHSGSDRLTCPDVF